MHTASATTAPHASLASARPFRHTLAGRVTLGFAATLFVAASAHVSIPLPFTPVPLTMQPLAVLLVGLALGPVDAFFAMLAYLAEGAAGLPVFAPSVVGLSGVAQLLGPTGGFLLSYPLVGALAGGIARITERKLPVFAAALIAGVVAVAVLFTGGASWFIAETHAATATAWHMTVAPFLPGEGVKILVAAGLYRALHRFAR